MCLHPSLFRDFHLQLRTRRETFGRENPDLIRKTVGLHTKTGQQTFLQSIGIVSTGNRFERLYQNYIYATNTESSIGLLNERIYTYRDSKVPCQVSWSVCNVTCVSVIKCLNPRGGLTRIHSEFMDFIHHPLRFPSSLRCQRYYSPNCCLRPH